VQIWAWFVVMVLAGGVAITAQLAGTGITMTASAGPPHAAVAGGTTNQGDAVVEYFKNNPAACARLTVDPALTERFPELPAVLAALKFTLSQQEWLTQPAIARESRFTLNRPSFADRIELLKILNDPGLKLDYEALTGTKIGGFTSSSTRVGLTNLGAIDPSLKKGVDSPYGLAATLIHELAHVVQLRRTGSEDGAAAHSDPILESEANSFALFMPRSLFAGDAWERIRTAGICGTKTPDGEKPDEPEPGKTSNVTASMILVFDASGSMGEKLPSGERRIDAAKAAVKGLLTSGALAPTVEVGLVIYYDCRNIDWEPFTTNHKSLVIHIEMAEPSGSTPLADAITEAIAKMKTEAAKNGQPGEIVVVSDGKETCGGNPYTAAGAAQTGEAPSQPQNRAPAAGGLVPVSYAAGAPAGESVTQQATDDGPIRVSTIGFAVGADTGKELAGIAQAGGGVYLPASGMEELTTALGEVASAVPADVPEIPNIIPGDDLREPSRNPWPWFGGALVAGLATAGVGVLAARRLQVVPDAQVELICGVCGETSPGTTRFCAACGASLPGRCSHCGLVGRHGAQFCRRCGRAFREPASPEP
jgi:hypothetical protein